MSDQISQQPLITISGTLSAIRWSITGSQNQVEEMSHAGTGFTARCGSRPALDRVIAVSWPSKNQMPQVVVQSGSFLWDAPKWSNRLAFVTLFPIQLITRVKGISPIKNGAAFGLSWGIDGELSRKHILTHSVALLYLKQNRRTNSICQVQRAL